MKVGIMQPYFFPYIGYFQLIASVDKFVIYDNIEYSKKGWVNRNRILINGKDDYITIPILKDSDYLQISERNTVNKADKSVQKIINKINTSYCKSTYFEEVFPLIKNIILNPEQNLFKYLNNSLIEILKYIEIDTEIVISSGLNINHKLKSKEKVIAICKNLKADQYINPIGGIDLYNKSFFSENSINLNFLKPDYFEYPQYNYNFVPWLSIIDIMMFNSKERIKELLTMYSLV